VDPRVWARFGEIVTECVNNVGHPPRRVLEIGGRIGHHSLLIFPELSEAERVCVNLEPIEDGMGIRAVRANGNDLPMFADGYFDWIVSNATLEHDPTFWKTLTEMRRLLKPGGLLIIGVPGFDNSSHPMPDGAKDVTLTLKYHTGVDYYRFSPRAVREVFFEGFNRVKIESILEPPRVIGRGRKPRPAPGEVTARSSSGWRAKIMKRVGVPPRRVARAR